MYMSTFDLSVFIGALITGSIIGAVPAICGAIKGKLVLGLTGFAACVISGLVLGALLAIPVCAIFIFLIFKPAKASESKQ